MGRGICLLHGATVKSSCKCLLSYWLSNYPFRFLLPTASVNISAHTLFAVCCKFEVLVLASCLRWGLSLSEN